MTLFGTDGVRGVAGRELTPEVALLLGRALGILLHERKAPAGNERPTVLVGRDSRVSGDMLEGALSAGLLAAGVDVVRLGILPTPAVAFLTVDRKAAAGAVISASHNPVEYNGIKFFGPDGKKLADSLEERVESFVANEADLARRSSITGLDVGRAELAGEERRVYEEHLLQMGPLSLQGWTVVVDAAAGAAAGILSHVLGRLGAVVVALHDQPDGSSINVACGSTHPDEAQRAVRETGARVGLTLDGDADRLIAIDEHGDIVDGDGVLAVLGLDMDRRGVLPKRTVVATHMSNGGLRRALRQAGIDLRITPVGDRHVLEEIERGGYGLGGEQSGHVILRRAATTGDGELTALALLEVMHRTQRSLSDLAQVVERMPQRLLNLPLARGAAWESAALDEAIADARAILGEEGRVMVRPSGTEPLLRVMVEGPDVEGVERAISRVAAAVPASTGVR